MATHKWVHPNEALADALEKGNGTLTEGEDGRLIRISEGSEHWNLSREWTGPRISSYLIDTSLWTKMRRIRFMAHAGGRDYPVFILEMSMGTTPEEMERVAQVYKTALNSKRKEIQPTRKTSRFP